jgi:hypothetical protein
MGETEDARDAPLAILPKHPDVGEAGAAGEAFGAVYALALVE